MDVLFVVLVVFFTFVKLNYIKTLRDNVLWQRDLYKYVLAGYHYIIILAKGVCNGTN